MQPITLIQWVNFLVARAKTKRNSSSIYVFPSIACGTDWITYGIFVFSISISTTVETDIHFFFFRWESSFLYHSVKFNMKIRKKPACLKTLKPNIRICGAMYDWNLELIIFFHLKKTFHPGKHFSPNRISARQIFYFMLNFKMYHEFLRHLAYWM